MTQIRGSGMETEKTPWNRLLAFLAKHPEQALLSAMAMGIVGFLLGSAVPRDGSSAFGPGMSRFNLLPGNALVVASHTESDAKPLSDPSWSANERAWIEEFINAYPTLSVGANEPLFSIDVDESGAVVFLQCWQVLGHTLDGDPVTGPPHIANKTAAKQTGDWRTKESEISLTGWMPFTGLFVHGPKRPEQIIAVESDRFEIGNTFGQTHLTPHALESEITDGTAPPTDDE
ncbi:MAG: hypothetical protein AAFY08_03045 [Planctomycetota bacterium]